jgi:HK97 family phage prohead protease
MAKRTKTTLEQFETRRAQLALRDNSGSGVRFTGYASVTERPYDMGWYTETIARRAFQNTLTDKPDVLLLVNHDGLPLARTAAGTLTLSEDERGLLADATLDPDDPEVQRLVRMSKRGNATEMSFSFSGAESEWNDDSDQRRIVALSLHRGDVSIVSFGANPYTSFSMRSRSSSRSLDYYRARAFVLGLR